MNKFVAYNIEHVRRKLSIDKARVWFKAGLIPKEHWGEIALRFEHPLNEPLLRARIFMFVLTLIGYSTLFGYFAFAIVSDAENLWQGLFFGMGVVAFVVAEFQIHANNQYKNGSLEASYYLGASCLLTALFGFSDLEIPTIFGMIFLVSTIISLRYLDLIALLGAIGSFMMLLFWVFQSHTAFLPFIIIITFSLLFYLSRTFKKYRSPLIWDDHFLVFEVVALVMIYLGGNYFVVREMSAELMGIYLEEGQDIPLAFFFYAYTCIIPTLYIYFGVVRRETLLIRVGLLLVALSILSIKYYYPGHIEFTLLIIGGLMLGVSALLIRYLRTPKNGFTREQLLSNKWDEANTLALGVSQTLGGNNVETGENASPKFDGDGDFGSGGAGASSKF